MQQILEYFPNLTDRQKEQFTQLGALYEEWNSKINVISRKDIENLYVKHVLHSLAITKVIKFKPEAEVLDLGTGGGFPGIPLAIFFPETKFTLIDGTKKKITVVQEVAQALGLDNVVAKQMRAEEYKDAKFDFIVTRAVATLDKLMMWSHRLFKTNQMHGIPNGLIALKGGELSPEFKILPRGTYAETYPISDFFEEDFFKEKYIIYVQA